MSEPRQGIPASEWWAHLRRVAARERPELARPGRAARPAACESDVSSADPDEMTDLALMEEVGAQLRAAAEEIRQRPRYARLGLSKVGDRWIVTRAGQLVGWRVGVWRDE